MCTEMLDLSIFSFVLKTYEHILNNSVYVCTVVVERPLSNLNYMYSGDTERERGKRKFSGHALFIVLPALLIIFNT